MAKRQRLTLQQALDEIFMDPLSKDDEDHLEDDDSDSDEYWPEIDGEVANEATDISVKCMHKYRKYKLFAEPITSSKNYLKFT